MSIYSRGLTNKNPFNIKYVKGQNWIGLSGSDGTFCKFQKLSFGVRAGIKLLLNYIRYYDCDDVESIIKRFAPHTENRTDLYVQFVKSRINHPEVVFTYEQMDWLTFFNMLRLIIRYENGMTYAEVLNYGFTDEYFYNLIKSFKLYGKKGECF